MKALESLLVEKRLVASLCSTGVLYRRLSRPGTGGTAVQCRNNYGAGASEPQLCVNVDMHIVGGGNSGRPRAYSVSRRDNGRSIAATFYPETNMPGLFARGDVLHGSVKRCASALGEGAMAVTFIHRCLRSQ